MARCKSWSPTNQVNCLILTIGIDRISLTTTQFSVQLSWSGFMACLLVVQDSSFLKRKSLTRIPFSYVILSRTGWHLPVGGFKILLWLIVWRLPTTDHYLDCKITSPFVRYI